MTLSPLKGPLTCKGTHTTCTELTNAFPDAVSVLLEDGGFYDIRHRSAIVFNAEGKVIVAIRAAYKNEIGEIVMPSFVELYNVPRYKVGDVAFVNIQRNGKPCVVESRIKYVYHFHDKATYILDCFVDECAEVHLFKSYAQAIDPSKRTHRWPIFDRLS